MKQTKNKYLRQLVRNYEIELQRPKGLKYLDAFLKAAINGLTEDTAIFISPTIHDECDRITRYKGYKVIRTSGLHRTQVIGAKESNLYF